MRKQLAGSNTCTQSKRQYKIILMPKKKFSYYNKTAYAGMLLTTIIWGAAGPIIKYTGSFIPPLTFLFLRFLIVCIVLLPYTIIELIENNINKKDYLNFFLLGISSQTSLALLFIGLKYTTSLDAAIIGLVGPILSITAGHYFYKDSIGKSTVVGIFLAALGTGLIAIEPILANGQSGISTKERIFGNVLVILYNLFWVVYVVWSKMSMGEKSPELKKALSFIRIKPMSKIYPPTLITALTFYVGLLTVIPFAIAENLTLTTYFDILSIDSRGLIGLFYMALLSSIVAYIVYQKSLDKLDVSEAAFFGYLSPIFTLPVAYILLKEVPNIYMVLGAFLIITGVVVAGNKSKRVS